MLALHFALIPPICTASQPVQTGRKVVAALQPVISKGTKSCKVALHKVQKKPPPFDICARLIIKAPYSCMYSPDVLHS